MKKNILTITLVIIGIILTFVLLIFVIKKVNDNKHNLDINQPSQENKQVNNDINSDEKIIIPSTDFDKIELNYEDFNLETKKSSISFNHVYKDKLYISITNKRNQNPMIASLFTTDKIVEYNLKTKESNVIEYNEDKRIWDYVIDNDKIYYTTVEYLENGLIEWNLLSSDLDFQNKTILKSGIISSGFLSPYIIPTNDKIYVSTVDESEKQYNFYQINDEKNIELVYSVDKNLETIAQFSKVLIKNGYIYYISLDKEKSHSLIKVDYKNNKKEIIYSINDINAAIFEFTIMDDFYVIDIIDTTGYSKLIYIYKDGTILKSNNNLFLAYFRKIENDKILTNNNDQLFRIFNKDGLSEKAFEFEGLDAKYNYLVYNFRYMIIANNEPNELYVYDLNKLR